MSELWTIDQMSVYRRRKESVKQGKGTTLSFTSAKLKREEDLKMMSTSSWDDSGKIAYIFEEWQQSHRPENR